MKNSLENILLLSCRLFDSESSYIVKYKNDEIEHVASNFTGQLDDDNIVHFLKKYPKKTVKNHLLESGKLKCFVKKINLTFEKNLFLLIRTASSKISDLDNENIELIEGLIKDYYSKIVLNKISLPNLVSGLSTPILLTDPSGNHLFANNRFYEEFKIKDAKKFSSESLRFFDENDNEIEFESYPFNLSVHLDRNLSEIKVKIRSGSHKGKWYSVNSILIKDESDDATKLVITSFWDISDVKEIEFSLNEAVRNVESVLYSVPADGNGYNHISNAVQRLFGYTPSEVYRDKYAMIKMIVPEHIGIFRKFRDKLMAGDRSVAEYQILDKSGSRRFLRNAAVPIMERKKVARIVGIITDITEQKEIVNKFKKSEEKYRLLIDTAEDIIFHLDAEGNFTMVNKNGANALGYSPDEMLGKYFLDFISDESKPTVGQAFIDIISSGQLLSFEAEFVDKVGDKIIFEIQARSAKFDESTRGVLGIGRDISEHMKNQHKLEELNKKLIEANQQISVERDKAKHQIDVLEELNRLKNEFISNVSHELRTPLASIIGFAETISTDKELPLEMVLEFNNIILNEGKRLAKLINDVLDFSKLESGQEGLNKSHFVFRTFLQEILAAFNEKSTEKNINFRAILPNDEIIVYADRERLSKAISHVLSNALKFTSPKGEVKVETTDQKEEVELQISDTGIGIPKEEIPNLFQKFSKISRTGSAATGAGFGLVTVKQIIDAHRGSIEVNSTVDKGTTFKIRLPKKN
jgi:PAS domain S-box-containing protein